VLALPNPRHEKFAQGLAEGKSAINAYELAGYKPDRGAASRLSANVSIRTRVARLQERGAERAAVTLQSLIDEAAQIQAKALADGQYSAAVAALTAKAKLSGHWVDYSENKNSNVIYRISDRPLTEAEWNEQYCHPPSKISDTKSEYA
jgi:phage terminase small subunit